MQGRHRICEGVIMWAEAAKILGPMILSKLAGGGSRDKLKRLDNYNPQQNNFLNQMMQMLNGGNVGQGQGDATDYWREMLNPSEESFNRFADPYKRQFEQETVPMLAERFAGAGGGMGGGLSSSGFGQALSSAGGNLQSSLAALKSGLGQQAAGGLSGQYSNLAGLGLGAQPFNYTYQPGGPSALQSFLGSYASNGFPGMGGSGNSAQPAASGGIGGGSGVAYSRPMTPRPGVR